MPKKTVLHTENLSIGYKNKKIANISDFFLEEGDFVAVIGINGAGKSTLLNTLTGNLPPIHGDIKINKRSLQKLSLQERAKEISIVLSKTEILSPLTVTEVIALGRQPYTNWIGKLSSLDKEIIKKSLKQLGIESLQNSYCNQLSDGQLQKVMLARAVAQDTSLIFLDEPTAHLDLYHKIYVLKLLKDLTKKTKKTIVFASHEIDLSLQLCNKIILVKNNQVFLETPENLIKKDHLNELFPKNIVKFDKSLKKFTLL